MEKYLVWFYNGKNTVFNGNANDLIEFYTLYATEMPCTVTVEFYDCNKYIGEVDYSFEEFCEIHN